MAMLRKFGNLAQFLFQHHLRQREDEYQSSLAMERQEALSKQNFAQRVLEKAATDPAFAARLKAGGQQMVGDMPIDAFIPSSEQAMGEVSKAIQEKPGEFDPLSIINRYNSTPGAASGSDARAPIEQLIQQRNSRMEQERLNTPRVKVSETLPTGGTQDRFINPAMQDEPITTGLDAGRRGELDLATWLSNEGSTARRDIETDQAGAEAGASAAAQLPYDLAKQRNAHLLTLERERDQRAYEASKLPPGIAEKVAGFDASLFSLDKLEMFVRTGKVEENLGPAAGRLSELQQSVPLLPTDPDFSKFLAETNTLRNATIKALTGAQMSEPEAKRIMGQLPLHTDKKEVWIQKAIATKENLSLLRNEMIKGVGSTYPQAPTPDPNRFDTPPLPEDPATAAAVNKLRELRKKRGL